MNIYEYLNERYPEASKSLVNGALNCVFKRYCSAVGVIFALPSDTYAIFVTADVYNITDFFAIRTITVIGIFIT